MLCIALEVCECFATCVVHMHGLVGVERLFCLDFWDRGRACARGGGYAAQYFMCVAWQYRHLECKLRHMAPNLRYLQGHICVCTLSSIPDGVSQEEGVHVEQ